MWMKNVPLPTSFYSRIKMNPSSNFISPGSVNVFLFRGSLCKTGVWDQCFSRDGIRSRPSFTKNPLRCSGLCIFRVAALINNSVPWADVTSRQYGQLKWCSQKCSLVGVTLVVGGRGSDTIPVHSTPDQQQKGIKPHRVWRDARST